MRAIAVAKKDLRELPGYFKISIVILPGTIIFLAAVLILAAGSPEAVSEIPNIPPSVFPPGLTDMEKSLYFYLNFMILPFFLMLATILPVTIAADAFAGERERKTLEALLAVPMSNRDLFLGKALLPLSYGFGSSLVAFVIITLIVKLSFPDAAISMPNASWLILIFLAVPAFSLLGILAELIISSRVDRTYYAVQIGSLVMLPLLVFVFGGVTGFLLLGPGLLLVLSGAVFLLDYILMQIGSDYLAKGI
jgi:ABC-2 type transport system permease protein